MRISVTARARSALYVACLTAAVAGGILVRNTALFSRPIYEYGDEAANSILVTRALHLSLLVGNYSRLRFNHPGPAFLYVQAVGQAALSSVLHAVPAPYNGQVVAAIVLNALLLALTADVVRRRLGLAAGIAFLLVCLLVTSHRLLWAFTWMPYMYAAPFLLMLVAAASVAGGDLADLPLFVLSGGLLVHGHVAFVPIMVVTSLATVAAHIVQRRRNGERLRAEANRQRRSLWASAAIAGVFALPMVVELVRHWPGPWGQYWNYSRRHATHRHGAMAVLRFAGRYWSQAPWETALFAAAAVAAIALAVTEKDRGRRRFLVMLLAGCALQTLLFAGFVAAGVDSLGSVDAYLGFFYYVVPAAVVAAAAAALVPRLEALGHQKVGAVAGAALAAAAAVFLWRSPSFAATYPGDPGLPAVAATVAQARPGPHADVVVKLATTEPAADGWPDVTGLMVAASRDGYHVCVADGWWSFMMTPQYICTAAQEKGALTVEVLPGSWNVPPGWREVAVDARMTVIESSGRSG